MFTNDIKLYPEQVEHFERIENILKVRHGAVDVSPTGRGKSYIALKMAQKHNLNVVVVAPPTILKNNWMVLIPRYGIRCVPDYGYISYQTLRGTSTGGCNPKTNKLLTRQDYGTGKKKDVVYQPTQFFLQLITEGTLLIIDEVQFVKNKNTLNHECVYTLIKTVISSPAAKSRFLLLSATAFDRKDMIRGYLGTMGLLPKDDKKIYTHENGVFQWSRSFLQLYTACLSFDKGKTEELSQKYLAVLPNNPQLITGVITDFLYEVYISVIKPKFVSSMLKMKQATCVSAYYKLNQDYHMQFMYAIQGLKSTNVKELQEAITELEQGSNDINSALVGAINELEQATVSIDEKTGRGRIFALSKIINKIERFKLSTYCRVVQYYLNQNPGYKLIIFLNSVDNIMMMCEALKGYNPIRLDGSVKIDTRVKSIAGFQERNNRCRLIIGNAAVASEGISLDDEDGRFPRIMVYSPNFYAIRTHQSAGRVQRANTVGTGVFIMGFAEAAQKELRLLTNLLSKANVLQDLEVGEAKSLFPGQYTIFTEEKSPTEGKFESPQGEGGDQGEKRLSETRLSGQNQETKVIPTGITTGPTQEIKNLQFTQQPTQGDNKNLQLNSQSNQNGFDMFRNMGKFDMGTTDVTQGLTQLTSTTSTRESNPNTRPVDVEQELRAMTEGDEHDDEHDEDDDED